MLAFLLVPLVVYAVVVGVFWVLQRDLLYPGAGAARAALRFAAPPSTEAIRIPTADGETLHALWRPPAPGCGVVVTFHGNASVPESHAARFVRAPWQGWGVLAVAYRGYAGSTGRPSEAGLLADGRAALAAAQARAPGAPLLLHGHSLGAALAVAMAAAHPHLGLYLEAPFDSMIAMARLHFPYLPAALLRDTYRSDRLIGAVAGPILIVHGDADPVIPTKFGWRLAQAAPAGTRFRVVPGDHVSLLGKQDREAEALFRARIPAPGCVAG
ncbi:alpha/beta hydrolase [Methylobacterium oryzisoli]|uniref:alpha/beta hydrolase n=1 Tax=Methylobacterium oryzisoli TaxID=3385502 RepID=UPI00389206C7